MRSFYLKRLLAVFMILVIIIVFSVFSAAAINIPSKVRVGLYYSDPAAGVKGALSSFNVSAVNGIQLGCIKDNNFNVLFEEPSNNNINIRKDSFFTYRNNCFTELNSTNNIIQDGSTFGPYHIQIGDSYPDINTVNQKLLELHQLGIVAYPVYIDTWQVWTGFYIDQNSAQIDLINNIQSKLTNIVCNVIQPSSNRIVAVKSTGETALIFGSNTSFLQIHPKQENIPYVLKINNSNSFRGDLEIRRFSDSDMTVINVVSLEDYLYGVVPSEMESWSNIEALKAQAVAARTYTLNSMGKHSKYSFDLCTTTACQVYKGYGGEAKSTNKAVDDTRGKILVYNGSPAQIYYFSSSGGKTEDVKNVWGSDIPYLKSVDDPYESGKSWKYNWELNITADKVKELVGSKLGDITSIEITKVSDAGRALEVVIKGTKDQRVYLKGSCRTIFSGTDYTLYSQWYTISSDADISIGNGTTTIKSQLSNKMIMTADGLKQIKGTNNKVTVIGANGLKKNVSLTPTTYKFSGKGWGHSVGMSQEGAKGFADAGYTYDQILTHYFTGTTVQ